LFFLVDVHRVVEHDAAVDAVVAQVEAVVGSVIVECRVRICIAGTRYVLCVVVMDDLSC
jgi:hypothetical protein